MTTPDAARHVYAWVTEQWDRDVPPTTLPAVRLWADVILEIVAEKHEMNLQPPIGIRRTSLFAWPQRVPPEHAAAETAGRRRVELTVDPAQCASARIDLVHDLVDPVSWRQLLAWLVDRGHERDFVEEDVVPLTAPTAAMFIDKARSAVESTSPGLLGEIVSYFEPAAVRYLTSWSSFAEASDSEVGELEIIVPPHAILSVVSGTLP